MQSSAGQIRNELFFFKKGHSVISICKYLFNIIIYFTVNSVNVAPLHIAADDSNTDDSVFERSSKFHIISVDIYFFFFLFLHLKLFESSSVFTGSVTVSSFLNKCFNVPVLDELSRSEDSQL